MNGLFDPEFFPTPRALAHHMLSPYRAAIESGEIASVLDPEAGKGDLLKPVIGLRNRPRIYAIEGNADLRGALAAVEIDLGYSSRNEKPIHVLGDDVFAYAGRHVFDLILANPPFSRGADHVLRHWQMLADGGHYAVLLNAETVRNPHTAARQQVAALIEQHGSVEDLGRAFASSERPTDVEVVLVRLRKPEAAGTFNFGKANRERSKPAPMPEDIAENAIARRDVVGNACQAFDLAAGALADLSLAWKRAEHYLDMAGVNVDDILPIDHRSDAKPQNVNALLDLAQQKAWHSIIDRSEVERYFTAKMRKEWDTFMAGQGKLDFNRANVLALFETIFMSRASIADAAVQDVFDRMCAFSPENKIAGSVGEGWKSNAGHKVNQKVIVPHYITHEFGRFHVNYHREYSELHDIDKALCHVMGRDYATLATIRGALDDAFKSETRADNTAQSAFFDIRFFKKGTLHLKFRDRKVWEMFNVAAARGKGWLGAQREAA